MYHERLIKEKVRTSVCRASPNLEWLLSADDLGQVLSITPSREELSPRVYCFHRYISRLPVASEFP